MHASPQEIMGENVFCESLAGEEIGRMKSWGTHPLSKAEHLLSSPCFMNDLPQTFMEPILFKTACSRGTQARMSTEYLRHEQDGDGVTTTCRDRLSNAEFTVRSKFLVGADGGNSLVAEQLGLPFEGKMGVGGSMNILFRADLSKYVAHRPSVLYWVMQPGADVGGIGMGLVRMVRPWNEWLIVWGYDINQPPPDVTPAFATEVARQLIGDPTLEIELLRANTWTVNNCFATHLQKDRVFIMGDAAHRHPPSNGLGSNTSIQDGFNLAWKLAKVVKGQAGMGLLDSYSAERAPVARQIVTRANQSIAEFGPIFEASAWTAASTTRRSSATWRRAATRPPRRGATRGAAQGDRLQEIRVRRPWRRDEPALSLVCDPHRRPGRAGLPGGPRTALRPDDVARRAAAPRLGVRPRRRQALDARSLRPRRVHAADRHRRRGLGRGGGGGRPELGLPIRTHVIGPRRAVEDHTGDWARASEIRDAGCLLVRPDHHVAWRSPTLAADPAAELRRVLKSILAR